MTRPYDLVLFGATGFTGALVAQELAASPEVKAGLRWAIAGRNRDKLTAIAATCGGPAIEVVDATDAQALATLAAKTTAIITTVGPYLRHGVPLAAACAAAGTHYCDLTGEPPFILKSIQQNHATATSTGARIVHCCGFDSIPSDLGTLLLQQTALAHGGACDVVRFTLMRAAGGVSGGTAHSLLAVMEAAASDPALAKGMRDAYLLTPGGVRGPDRGDFFGVKFDDDVNGYVGPFFMAAINTRVVRRSHHLLGMPWGNSFSYNEQHRFGRGLKGQLAARAVQASMIAVLASAATSTGRSLLAKVLPVQGAGPNEATREAGHFTCHLHGHRKSDGAHFRVVVQGHKDPGYGGTAIMLAQAGLCLARDALTSSGGVTTPAAAMGTALIERLRTAGMTFTAERL